MQSRSFLATATSLSVVSLAAVVAVFLASSATSAATISAGVDEYGNHYLTLDGPIVAGDASSIPYITPDTSNDPSSIKVEQHQAPPPITDNLGPPPISSPNMPTGQDSAAHAQSSDQQKGCPIDFAVQQVDAFVRNRMLEYAKLMQPILQEWEAIAAKASKQGIAIGKQLSPKDLNRFNQLRHELTQMRGERLVVSNFQRDVHLIYETYNVAKLADLYEIPKESLGDADPRRFYFTVLQQLRVAQPRTSRTPLISTGFECDPEAGLFFEEEFNQQQLAKLGADQRLVNLVFDIERIRTFYQLCWNVFNKSIDDVRATTWKGDVLNAPDSITPMISTSDTATQNMFRDVISYIDKQLPSEIELETRYFDERHREILHDYPVQRK